MSEKIEVMGVVLMMGATLVSCTRVDEARSSIHCDSEPAFHELSGPYLGQQPPGMEAELFAPGLLSAGSAETAITFSRDGMELSYSFMTTGGTSLAEPRGPFLRQFIMHSHVEDGHCGLTRI